MDLSRFQAEEALDRALACGVLRLTLGVNILLHGVTRFHSGVGAFASATVAQFSGTPLPEGLVRLFATALPSLESALGFLIAVGLWTRFALVGGGLLMTALVFGTALRSEWTTLGIQLVYAVVYFLSLTFRVHDRISLDGLLGRSHHSMPNRSATKSPKCGASTGS